MGDNRQTITLELAEIRRAAEQNVSEQMIEITQQTSEKKITAGQQTVSQKKANLREIGFFALCFLAPMFLMAIIWGSIGIGYGGEVTPLTYDMRGQYMPFYASLRYILSGENSILFSWSFFMGSNFMGAYALDLASPLSWLTVLWSLENMPDAIYVLTLLKIGLCGLSFAFFTRFGLAGGEGRRCGIANVLFSCCYALMSYNIMYSIFLPWLEEVILLPLILLGIEKLLQGKKGFLYFISITGAFICNYYISYMVGIFAALYILCRVLSEITGENRKNMLKALIRFGINTVLALGISMPLLLPVLRSLIHNMTEQNTAPPTGAYEFPFWQFLQKLLPGYYDSIENWGLPSIYCGSIMVLMAAAYFGMKRYSRREKLSYVLLIAVPFAGFLCKEADLAWHGFRYPSAVPYRYAFLFSAAVLILAWKAYACIPMERKFIKLLGVMGGCYLCVELFFNGAAIISGIHKEMFYETKYRYKLVMDYTLPLTEKIREEEGFFRSEAMLQYLDRNEPAFYGLRGISNFHSASNMDVQMILYIMGNQLRYPAVDGRGLTPVGDSLLGVKYRITPDEFLEGYEMNDVSTGQFGDNSALRLYLQENKNALSLGYMVDEENILKDYAVGADVFENQNRILEAMGVKEPEVFHKLDINLSGDQNKKNVKFTTCSDNPVYYYVWGEKEKVQYDEESGEWVIFESKIDVCLDGGEKGNVELDCTKYLGSFEEGNQLSMELDLEDGKITIYDVYVYEFDKEKYEAAMNELKEGELQITSLKGGHIMGTVTAKQGQMLFLTLPTDRGYRVSVDGERSPYATVLGVFLAVPLTEGEHQIEINYVPPGLKEGIVVGLVAFVLTLLYFGIGKKCAKC